MERLAEGPVLGDGGYLLELEKRGYVQAGPFTPGGGDRPSRGAGAAAPRVPARRRRGAADHDLLRQRRQAGDGGTGGKVDDINRNAVRIAREVAAEGDALVAGNLSLTWAYDPADAASPDHVRALLDRQLQDQIDAGPPDFWIGETFSYLGEALLFVERAKRDRPAGHGDDVVRDAAGAVLRGRRPRRRARSGSPTRAPTSWA